MEVVRGVELPGVVLDLGVGPTDNRLSCSAIYSRVQDKRKNNTCNLITKNGRLGLLSYLGFHWSTRSIRTYLRSKTNSIGQCLDT